jgi:hypothetical protein
VVKIVIGRRALIIGRGTLVVAGLVVAFVLLAGIVVLVATRPSTPAVLPDPPPTTPGPRLDASLPAAGGEHTLAANFAGDPQRYPASGGGPVDMSYLEECAGWAAQGPGLRLTFTGDGGPLRLFVVPETTGVDTSLVVQAPDGTWHCSDDAVGLDPLIDFAIAPSGTYGIWVATDSAASVVGATVFVTELVYVRPDTVTSQAPA